MVACPLQEARDFVRQKQTEGKIFVPLVWDFFATNALHRNICTEQNARRAKERRDAWANSHRMRIRTIRIVKTQRRNPKPNSLSSAPRCCGTRTWRAMTLRRRPTPNAPSRMARGSKEGTNHIAGKKNDKAAQRRPVGDPVVCHRRKSGAGEGARTLDPDLGKVVLYH